MMLDVTKPSKTGFMRHSPESQIRLVYMYIVNASFTSYQLGAMRLYSPSLSDRYLIEVVGAVTSSSQTPPIVAYDLLMVL
jgi:hypothetical protein